jgi:hypothetical protein
MLVLINLYCHRNGLVNRVFLECFQTRKEAVSVKNALQALSQDMMQQRAPFAVEDNILQEGLPNALPASEGGTPRWRRHPTAQLHVLQDFFLGQERLPASLAPLACFR